MTREAMGVLIRQKRIEKGLTQIEFGWKIGYTRDDPSPYIRAVESGKYYPPYNRIRAIHEVLGIDYDKLVP